MKNIFFRTVSLLLGLFGLLACLVSLFYEPFKFDQITEVLVAFIFGAIFLIFGLGGTAMLDKTIKDNFFTKHYLYLFSGFNEPKSKT